MKKLGIITLAVCVLILSIATTDHENQDSPQINYVPNEQTAVRVAEVIWTELWGEKFVNGCKPFSADSSKGVWHVHGKIPSPGSLGGTIHMKLQICDCKILEIRVDK